MKNLRTKLLWIIAASLVALGLAYGLRPAPVAVEVACVQRGSLDVTVDEDGETRIREKYVVSAPVGGRLLRLQLQAGDEVEQGQTELVRIEPNHAALLDARTQAESDASLRAAEAAAKQAAVSLQRAEDALKLAENDYQRGSGLAPTKAISPAEFDQIRHARRLAMADVRSAEAAVKVSFFELQHAKAAAARYDVNQQDEETAFRLVSPINGRVLRVFQKNAGVVAAGTPLLELGDPQDLEINVDVLSTSAVRIKTGDLVYLEHWGGEESLTGVVRLVEPSAFLRVSALGIEEKRVNVIADFVDPWQLRSRLGDGFRVEARIVVATTADDSLKIPTGALVRDERDWFVFRVVDGIAERRTVTIGETNGVETEVVDGLREGDYVVIHPSEKIQPGIHVTAQPLSQRQ